MWLKWKKKNKKKQDYIAVGQLIYAAVYPLTLSFLEG